MPPGEERLRYLRAVGQGRAALGNTQSPEAVGGAQELDCASGSQTPSCGAM